MLFLPLAISRKGLGLADKYKNACGVSFSWKNKRKPIYSINFLCADGLSTLIVAAVIPYLNASVT